MHRPIEIQLLSLANFSPAPLLSQAPAFPNNSPRVSPRTSCGRAALGALFIIVLPLTSLAREHFPTQLVFPFLHCTAWNLVKYFLEMLAQPTGQPLHHGPQRWPPPPACSLHGFLTPAKLLGFNKPLTKILTNSNLKQIPTFLSRATFSLKSSFLCSETPCATKPEPLQILSTG